MSKTTGLGQRLLIDEYDVSGDTGAINSLGSPKGTQNVTGIDKRAVERLYLTSDSQGDFRGFYNPTNAHLAYSSLPTTARLASWLLGTALGEPVATMNVKQVNYNWSRADNGALTTDVNVVGSEGIPLEWAEQLTTGVDDFTGPAATGSVDVGVATTGGAVVAHCIEFTGTSARIDLQASSDDGGGDPFEDVEASPMMTFSAVGAQRLALQSATAVEQYVRANITGTFTTASLAIFFVEGAPA